MSILVDHEILALCTPQVDHTPPMIEPFIPVQVSEIDVGNGDKHKVVSYGLSSSGYDIRCSERWKVFTDLHSQIVDPKNVHAGCFVDVHRMGNIGDYMILPPNSYALTHSVEYIRLPRNVTGVCMGKSTYARCGIHVNVTPLEPGWEGQITIEVSNGTRLPVRIYINEGIMQVQFHRHEEVSTSYADRKGKYMHQQGIVLPKMK